MSDETIIFSKADELKRSKNETLYVPKRSQPVPDHPPPFSLSSGGFVLAPNRVHESKTHRTILTRVPGAFGASPVSVVECGTSANSFNPGTNALGRREADYHPCSASITCAGSNGAASSNRRCTENGKTDSLHTSYLCVVVNVDFY